MKGQSRRPCWTITKGSRAGATEGLSVVEELPLRDGELSGMAYAARAERV